MQKQVIILMESDQYPFGEFDTTSTIAQSPNFKSNSDSRTQAIFKSEKKLRVLVRKIFLTRSLQERNQLLEKIGMIRSLEHPNIIKIQSVLEEENGIHILMEYVPLKISQYLFKNKKDGYDTLTRNIYDFERNLREEGIKIQWNVWHIGLTESSQLKFYINVEKMVIEPDLYQLRKVNEKQLNNLFEDIHSLLYPIKDTKQTQKNRNSKQSSTDLHNDSNLNKFDPQSSYTSNNNISRQSLQTKAASQRMRVNWRQIEQNSEILNDFINVLQDREQQQVHEDIQNSISEEEQIRLEECSQKQNQSKLDRVQETEEEVVWETTTNIKDKVQAAIRRSRRVMEMFKKMTGLAKEN